VLLICFLYGKAWQLLLGFWVKAIVFHAELLQSIQTLALSKPVFTFITSSAAAIFGEFEVSCCIK
jgi:hypothetical protein